MKTYEETVAVVLGRMELHERRKKQRRDVYTKGVAGVGGLCLAVLLGLGVQNGNVPKGPEGTDGPVEDKVVICPVEMGVPEETGGAPLQLADICLLMGDFVEMAPEELAAYYGAAVIPEVPADLEGWNNQRYGVFRKDGGEGPLYWDGNVLSFSNEERGRAVSLRVWKVRRPVSCVTLFDLVEEKSVINGVEMAVGVAEGGYYHAEFMYKDVGFHLIAEGLSQDEVVGILRSLIQ